jgi:hypothetical protein
VQNNSLGLNAIDEVLVALDHLCGLDHVSHIQIRQLPVTLDHIAKSAVTAVHEIAARSHELGVKEKEEPLKGWKKIQYLLVGASTLIMEPPCQDGVLW